MRRRELLALLASSGCTARSRQPASPLSRALLELTRASGEATRTDTEAAETELAHLTDLSREALERAPKQPPVTAVCRLLFDELGFAREVSDQSLGFVLLPSVLRSRRGSCVGLGTLLLGLSERLGWSAAGVLMPGHFYVRVRAPGPARNVELLRKGEAMSDGWYAQRFPVQSAVARAYGRPLSEREVLGVVAYDIGNERRRQGRLDAAMAAFERAVQAFPDFAEAQASLGAVAQLQGRLELAEASYRAALEKNPSLPGLEQNLSLLAEERAGSR
jgi:regulator of sirC expression with transglutaminase-like and TPR domain